MNYVCSLTLMQISFGVIMLALVDGRPEILNLEKILKKYIEFQLEVITRRTQFDLKKAQDRAHILEGLMIALDFIDEVVAMLRAAKSIPEGKAALMERFDLDDPQAQAIVQMRLGQLTGLERSKVEEELEGLRAKIADLLDILGSEARRLGIIKDEAIDMKKRFGDERRTEIAAISGEVDIEDLIPVEECVLTLTRYGYVKRQKMENYRTQKRGGRGVSAMSRREEDAASHIFVTGSHDYVLFFSDMGRMYRVKCYEVPEGSRTSKGMHIRNLLPLQGDENITSVVHLSDLDDDKFLVMVTRRGVVKRTKLSAFNNVRKAGLIAVDLDEGDYLAHVLVTGGSDELIFSTRKGMTLCMREEDIRAMGRAARGVKVMRLGEGDAIVGMDQLRDGGRVLTVTETGFGRLSPIEDYRVQKRGGKGLKNYHVDKFGDVAGVKVVFPEEDIIMISSDGIIIRISAGEVRQCARPSKGVRVMRVQEGEKIVTLASAPKEETEETDTELETEQ